MLHIFCFSELYRGLPCLCLVEAFDYNAVGFVFNLLLRTRRRLCSQFCNLSINRLIA